MKKITTAAFVLFLAMTTAFAGDIVKTGMNYGPLPALAFDADKGFQYGAILQLYWYGDGHNYPNYDNKTYLEYSRFTKGSQLIQVQHDNKELIPGVRWSSALRINIDGAFDFYGLNGYESWYAHERMNNKDAYPFNPFYKMKRNEFIFRSDFIGQIPAVPGLKWEAGVFAKYYQIGTIDYDVINKGKESDKAFPSIVPTLYDIYVKSGVLNEKEADGGFTSGIRLGVVYDTRDKEGAPTRGIWAETHITAAPGFLSETPYYRYSLTWRQYFPIIDHDILTFAYRLNYEGNIGNTAPFYALPYLTCMGESNDRDGMGGYGTVRGVMRTRIVGLDMATGTAELRWRFVKFNLWNQNIAFGLSAFADGAVVTRGRDLENLKSTAALSSLVAAGLGSSVKVVNEAVTNDKLHLSTGAGLRFIMNENFIVAFEYGTPISHWLSKDNSIYNQDGNGAFYINLGYVF